jgi:DNA-directed RNA polymerase II subunit RPB2
VAQVLNRLTFASTLSHLRRLNTPIGREGKLAKPRQLHNTHWGVICPAETPEGHACGLVKNMALMAQITVDSPAKPVLDALSEWSVEYLEEVACPQIPKATKVFVNGLWVGIHREPDELVAQLRSIRRSGELGVAGDVHQFEIALVYDVAARELRVQTDAGRMCRPLFVVQDQEIAVRKSHIRKILEKVGPLCRLPRHRAVC